MSDQFYIDIRDNTVVPLMEQFGFNMTLRSSREPVIDPDTGAITTAATPISTIVRGITRFYSQDEIDGKDVLANDIQVLIGGKELSDAGILPDTSMQVIAQGNTYNVVRVTPTQPGGINVIYRLQVRK